MSWFRCNPDRKLKRAAKRKAKLERKRKRKRKARCSKCVYLEVGMERENRGICRYQPLFAVVNSELDWCSKFHK